MSEQPTEPPNAANLEEWLTWASTKVALSLAVTLYWKPPREGAADGLLECYREFLDLCEPHLSWYASENSRYRKADAKVLRIPFRRLSEVLVSGKDWCWMAFAGAGYKDAAPSQFLAVLSDDPGNLSYVRAAFPIEMFAADLRPFVSLVKRFAARVPFFFGSGGFSFSESLEIGRQQTNERYLVPVAMRFSGIEVESHISTAICCKDTVKGVNWLTLIAPSLVERLGGREVLRAQLTEEIVFHDLPTGLMLQAGPIPGLGDVNAGERLPLYREVHKALTPVRVVGHWTLGDRAFLADETRRWMGRFDD